MNYTQAQIDRANAVSLEDFLRTQGETLIKSGARARAAIPLILSWSFTARVFPKLWSF